MASATSIATRSPSKGRYDPLWRALALTLNAAIVALPIFAFFQLRLYAIFLSFIAMGAVIALAGFAVTVIALNRWRLTRAPLIALVIPVVLLVCFVVPGARAMSDIADLLYYTSQFTFQVLVLAAVLRLLGFRLYVSRADYIAARQWRYSVRSLLVISIFVAVYTSVILDIVSNGPIHNTIARWLGLTGGSEGAVPYNLLFMQIAVVAAATSLIGWWAWSANVLVGIALFTPIWYYRPAPGMFTFRDAVLLAYVTGCVVLCATIITMPWLGLGWRVRWDKPVWEREFNPAVVS